MFQQHFELRIIFPVQATGPIQSIGRDVRLSFCVCVCVQPVQPSNSLTERDGDF